VSPAAASRSVAGAVVLPRRVLGGATSISPRTASSISGSGACVGLAE
jgi:hypothetical protein